MSQIDLCRTLDDPVLGGADIFRTVLDAMAHPGQSYDLSKPLETPEGLNPVAFSVALVLVDADTTLFLSPLTRREAAIQNLRFHCNCPIVDTPEDAAFAIMRADEAEGILPRLPIGTPEYPDRSATAIIMVPELAEDETAATLTGPGIKDSQSLPGFDRQHDVLSALSRNALLFPLGYDTILAGEEKVLAIPRSSHIHRQEREG